MGLCLLPFTFCLIREYPRMTPNSHLLLLARLALLTPAAPAQHVLLEAEQFADPGGWDVDQQSMDQMGSPYLLAHGLGVPVRDAMTKFRRSALGLPEEPEDGDSFDLAREGVMGASNLWNLTDVSDPAQVLLCECKDKEALRLSVRAGSVAAPFPRCPWALDLTDRPFPGRRGFNGQWAGAPLDNLGGWFWESGFDKDQINDLERIRDLNFRAMYGAWDALKNVARQFSNRMESRTPMRGCGQQGTRKQVPDGSQVFRRLLAALIAPLGPSGVPVPRATRRGVRPGSQGGSCPCSGGFLRNQGLSPVQPRAWTPPNREPRGTSRLRHWCLDCE